MSDNDGKHDDDDGPVGVPAPPPAPDTPPAESDAQIPTQEPAIPRRKRRSTLRGLQAQPDPRKLRERVRDLVRHVAAKEGQKKRVRVPVYALRVTMQVVRQWARDRCPQQAASLAFQTVLSVVPMLALALALLRATGNIGAESTLVHFIADTFIPMSQDEIAATLTTWSENITFETLGLVGLIVTLAVAFVMFNTLEKIMNDIWRTERRRPLGQKLIVFYAIATILPVGAGIVLYQAKQLGLTSGFSGFLMSFVVSWGGAFLCIYVMPKTLVHVRSAAAGALVSALLFEAAKALFQVYAANMAFDKQTTVYGAVALAPILLIWIYYSWLVLLLGCEVAYAAQHLHLLEGGERRERMPLEKELVRRVNGVVGARVMVAVAEAYLAGRKVLSRRAIADRFDLSDEVIDRLAARLKEADLLVEVKGDLVGFMPARQPTEIALSEILGAFRGDDVLDTSPHPHDSPLDRILHDIEQSTLERTRSLSLSDLVDPPR